MAGITGMDLFGSTKLVAEVGGKYVAIKQGNWFNKGDIVEVTFVSQSKVTAMGPRASFSVLPDDFKKWFQPAPHDMGRTVSIRG